MTDRDLAAALSHIAPGRTAGEHLRVAAQMKVDANTCPDCGEPLVYEPPTQANQYDGVAAWSGGWGCQCGWQEPDIELDGTEG